MADKTDDLIISISTDLTTVKRQLRELGQSVTQATGGASKSFVAFGKQIDQSLTPIQKRINQMTGVPLPTKGIREWKGALADVAVEAQLVSRGIKLNRIGMMELQAAGVNTFQALASGMSIERVAMMEGAQVIGAVVQGVEGVGARIAALATPMNLAVVGIVAAASAIVAYGISGGESIEKLDDILKQHKANIALLGEAYDKVAEKQQNAAVISAKTANILIADDARKLQAALKAGISNIFNGATETQLSSAMGALTTETVVKSQFQPFAKALEDLNNSAKDATALRTFLDTVTALSDQSPAAAAQLIHMADGVNQIAQALPGASQPVDAVTASFSTLQEAINKIAPGDAKDKLQDLFDDAKTGKTGIDDVTSALATLENTNLTLAGPIAALQALFKNAVAARNALNPQSQLPPLGTVGPVYSGGGKFIDANRVQTDHANTVKSQTQLAAEKLARATRAPRQNSLERGLQQSKDRTAQLNAEAAALATVNPLVSDYGRALATATEKQRLINDANKTGVALTPDVLKSIDQQAEAYGASVAALGRVHDAQDRLKQSIEETADAARDFTSTFIDDMLSGKSAAEALGDALKKLGERILNSGLDQLFGGGSVNGGGAFGSLISSFFGGGGGGGDPWAGLRANGGPVEAGKAYVVGEKRPELFVPRSSGTIIPRIPAPMMSGGSGATSITYAPTIDARGADSAAVARIQDTLARDKAEFSVKVLAAVRKAKKSNEKGL